MAFRVYVLASRYLRDRLRLRDQQERRIIFTLRNVRFLSLHSLQRRTRRVALSLGLSAALGLGVPASALAAPGDGPCTVVPGAVSNLAPTLVSLRSASDDGSNPISAHVGLEHPLLIRDPGGDGTARPNLRSVPAAEQTVVGENIGFSMPPANIAGQFEVLTLVGEGTSDCLPAAGTAPPGGVPAPAPATPTLAAQASVVSGVYDGLAIGQAEVLQLQADSTTPLQVTVRGTSKGAPLKPTTLVTLSTSRGEFVAVNGEPIAATKVVQLPLGLQPSEGAAVGTVLWQATPGERAGAATMTATALQDGVSLFKTVMAQVLPPPVPEAAPFTGTLPGAGQSALLVTTRSLPTAELASSLDAAGCLPQTLSVLVAGVWEVYVPGAPGPVNEGFVPAIALDTPFVVRCG